MESILMTSLSAPEIRELLQQELAKYFDGTALRGIDHPADEQPVDAKELCNFLNITEPTLIRWRNKGKIPYMRIGSRILYLKSKVIAQLSADTERRKK